MCKPEGTGRKPRPLSLSFIQTPHHNATHAHPSLNISQTFPFCNYLPTLPDPTYPLPTHPTNHPASQPIYIDTYLPLLGLLRRLLRILALGLLGRLLGRLQGLLGRAL